MYNDYTDLTEKEKDELNKFKTLFFEGFQIKKKCLLIGWVYRTIKLSKDSKCIEWISERVHNNQNLINKRFFYIGDIKQIFKGDNQNSSFLTTKVSLITDLYVQNYLNNYVYQKKIIYEFNDLFLSNIFYQGMILLKKENDINIILNYNLSREVRLKIKNN